MKKMTILVPVTLSSILLSAVVFASTVTTDAEGTTAKAPNRADLFSAAACGAPAVAVLADATSWQNALGNKRIQDRALLMPVKGNADLAKDCAAANE
jgi:hypothetical protein